MKKKNEVLYGSCLRAARKLNAKWIIVAKSGCPPALYQEPNAKDCEEAAMFAAELIYQEIAIDAAQRFVAKLDASILFHRNNTQDPHSIGNAVLCSLTEVRDCFAHANGLPLSPRPKS